MNASASARPVRRGLLPANPVANVARFVRGTRPADLLALGRVGLLRPVRLRGLVSLAGAALRERANPHLISVLHAARDPGGTAVAWGRGKRSWGELRDRIERLMRLLIEEGVGPGHGVALALPNRPEFVETAVAALAVGADVFPLNPRIPAAEMDRQLAALEPGLTVTTVRRKSIPGRVLHPGAEFEDALERAPQGRPPIGRFPLGRIVLFTSGTEGRPKGAVHPLANNASLAASAGLLRVLPLRTGDVTLVACPLYHAAGVGFAVIAHVLGNELVLLPRFTPEAFARAVERHGVTTAVVVPTMLHVLAEWGGAGDHDLSTLRAVICTGSPLLPDLRDWARGALGDVLFDLYGSAEAGWVSVATPGDQRERPGTVGRPLPHVEVRVRDESGADLPAGEAGEVWASSRMAMSGYLSREDAGMDDAIPLGDRGYLDEYGYLFVLGRADDLIITGGVNVYPAEVESALLAHPAVADVAVFGVPDLKWGRRVAAAVVRRSPVEEATLRQWSRRRLRGAAVPKELRFVDAIPRNPAGKVLRRKLVSEATDQRSPGPA